MNDVIDRRKTLEELEQDNWGEPNFDSYLVTTCHRLHRKPLNQFTVEDLRIMIGQQISLPILVPLAMEVLEADPLAQGDYYPGDLLTMVFKVEVSYWAKNANQLKWIRRLVSRLNDSLISLDEYERSTIQDILKMAPRSITSI